MNAGGGVSGRADAPLDDASARARIRTDLDSNLLVEAGAGSGKTTALVDRMLTRHAPFGARMDDPNARLRLRGWLGCLEAASLDWAETQELHADAVLQLLFEMSNFVFASVLGTTEPR